MSTIILLIRKGDKTMELFTISKVAKMFNISTRTLRYYDKMGILPSIKKEDYAYRTYDDSAIKQLQQIIVLRKLRIKLKDIEVILQNKDAVEAMKIFQQSLEDTTEEIKALSTIESILETFIDSLNKSLSGKISLELLRDETIVEILNTLTLSKVNLKEEKSMEDLNRADEKLSKLRDVRIIYLPPATVASSNFIGENPEDTAGNLLNDFVRQYNLHKVKPDLRVYGFNNPCPMEVGEVYGYEFWVTIPEDMEVPKPLEKKHFQGGLYAAHCIKMGSFEEWQLINQWVKNSEEYEYDPREPLGMDGLIEEHLNAHTYYETHKEEASFKQVDLLIPIKLKK